MMKLPLIAGLSSLITGLLFSTTCFGQRLPYQDPALSSEEKIDYYGPCNQDPLGKDQLTKQRLESSDRKSH